jgi:hypothetical protein
MGQQKRICATPFTPRCEQFAEVAFRHEGGRRGNLVFQHAAQTEIATLRS